MSSFLAYFAFPRSMSRSLAGHENRTVDDMPATPDTPDVFLRRQPDKVRDRKSNFGNLFGIAFVVIGFILQVVAV